MDLTEYEDLPAADDDATMHDGLGRGTARKAPGSEVSPQKADKKATTDTGLRTKHQVDIRETWAQITQTKRRQGKAPRGQVASQQ